MTGFQQVVLIYWKDATKWAISNEKWKNREKIRTEHFRPKTSTQTRKEINWQSALSNKNVTNKGATLTCTNKIFHLREFDKQLASFYELNLVNQSKRTSVKLYNKKTRKAIRKFFISRQLTRSNKEHVIRCLQAAETAYRHWNFVSFNHSRYSKIALIVYR